MYNITVNGNSAFRTQVKIEGQQFEAEINGQKIKGDFLAINPYQYNLLFNGRSVNVDLVRFSQEEKSFVLKINGNRYTLQLKDKYDELLHTLGLDKLAGRKVNEIKAPMPGMVLKVLVSEGQEVKKGDALLILEAMKMENILKAPADGQVKKIDALTGTAVEKNQLLIHM